ncbi:MAG: 50S ribosomal protein L10 [Anaerolineales bacterium]|nr:50S ribosomal protein L10 [Anaerolineales bacterium]MCX7607639.1 50S ribosomal protein L10 [Anaerolineales bacterium]MDW8228156.1 50S ribosomal protein L10 [Anaerolineales bacterium]
MAKTKQQKEAMLSEYLEWLGKSKAIVLVEYSGLTMKNLDAIRAKLREVGGEFHIVKNTLAKLALERMGYQVPESFVEKSTAIGFAFADPAAFTKALMEATKGLESVKVKGGYMDAMTLTPTQVKAIAELPPLPVVRSQLLGVLQAPANKLVRTLAEPGRALAYVIRAHHEPVAA